MRQSECWIVVEMPGGGFQLGWLERGRVETLALEGRRYTYRENAEVEALRRNKLGIMRHIPHPFPAH